MDVHIYVCFTIYNAALLQNETRKYVFSYPNIVRHFRLCLLFIIQYPFIVQLTMVQGRPVVKILLDHILDGNVLKYMLLWSSETAIDKHIHLAMF